MMLFGAHDWNAVLPIMLIAGTGLIVLLLDLLAPKRLRRSCALLAAAIGSLAAGGAVLAHYHAFQKAESSVSVFAGAFSADGFTLVFEAIIILAVLLTLTTAYALGREDQGAGGVALLLWSASGGMLAAGAGDLMTVFLGIELTSLALYCLCALAPRAAARESALKYLILSSTASGFMLYGMALLFGAVGSVALAAFAAPPASPALFTVGLGLFFVGLMFKLSLAPFHMWAPDVYEGAPLPVTAFMSVVVKAAVFAVLARVLYAALPVQGTAEWLLPLWIAAGLSMLVGNAAALAQTDMKRLLAYSGIAQIGYIVAALAGTTAMGLRYGMFYTAAYAFMNLGAFAVLALLSRHEDEGSHLRSFVGLGHRKPVLAALMTFFLLSLAGLPPTVGFTGKILLLASMVNAGYAWLAALLVMGTGISIYAYLKVVRAMYARTVRAPQGKPLEQLTPLPWVGVLVCAAAVLVLGLYPFFPGNVLPLLK